MSFKKPRHPFGFSVIAYRRGMARKELRNYYPDTTLPPFALAGRGSVSHATLYAGDPKMRKTRLDLGQLVVESFDTAGGKEKTAGTVRGHNGWTAGEECPSDGSYCATCGHGGQVCPHDTMTCFASCLMTYGNAACIEPNCMGA